MHSIYNFEQEIMFKIIGKMLSACEENQKTIDNTIKQLFDKKLLVENDKKIVTEILESLKNTAQDKKDSLGLTNEDLLQ